MKQSVALWAMLYLWVGSWTPFFPSHTPKTSAFLYRLHNYWISVWWENAPSLLPLAGRAISAKFVPDLTFSVTKTEGIFLSFSLCFLSPSIVHVGDFLLSANRSLSQGFPVGTWEGLIHQTQIPGTQIPVEESTEAVCKVNYLPDSLTYKHSESRWNTSERQIIVYHQHKKKWWLKNKTRYVKNNRILF